MFSIPLYSIFYLQNFTFDIFIFDFLLLKVFFHWKVNDLIWSRDMNHMNRIASRFKVGRLCTDQIKYLLVLYENLVQTSIEKMFSFK